MTNTTDSAPSKPDALAIEKNSIATPPAVYQQNPKSEDVETGLAVSIHPSTTIRADSTNVSTSDLGSDASSMAPMKPEHPWSGYLEDTLPSKTQGKKTRNLRHQIFTLYRRLFGVVFITNMAVFISVIFRGANAQQIGTIVIANLFCAILMRQDYVINAFFNVFCSVPASYVYFLFNFRHLMILIRNLAGLLQSVESVQECTTLEVYILDALLQE